MRKPPGTAGRFLLSAASGRDGFKTGKQAFCFPSVEAASGLAELALRLLQTAQPREAEAQVVADDARPRVVARQRPQPGERLGGIVLVEAPDCRRYPGGQVLGLELGRADERVGRRDRSARPLVRGPEEEPVCGAARFRPTLQLHELAVGRQALELGPLGERRHEGRPAGGHLRMEQVLRPERGRGVGIAPLRLSQLARRRLRLAARQKREPEMEPRDAALRLLVDETAKPLDGSVRPGRDRLADRRLDRAWIVREDLLESLPGGGPLAVVEEALRLPEGASLGIVAREETELERGRGQGGAGLAGASVLGLEDGDADDHGRRDRRRGGDEDTRARVWRHACERSHRRPRPGATRRYT